VRRFFSIIGIVLALYGAYGGVTTYLFVRRAVTIEAQVIAIEERKGPPKPRSKTPIHLRYTLPDGSEHLSKTSMPLLQAVKAGDRVKALVDPKAPEVVRLPLASVLWALPLATCVVGAVMTILARCVPHAAHARSCVTPSGSNHSF
jgi:hypothetical protein